MDRRNRLSSMWFAKAGYQARRLKRRVVRPVSNSLEVEECVGEVNSPGGIPVKPTDL
jgi:hypothetical protein